VAWKLAEGLTPEAKARLEELTTPRMSRYVPQKPHPKQRAFLCYMGREGLFGGAAGPGKSSALLMAASQFACVPGYAALLLRQSYPQLVGNDGLIARAKEWFAPAVADREMAWSEQWKRFTFRESGATISFGYLDRDDDRYNYQGLAYQFVGFDELTQWPTTTCYSYVGFSRVRAVDFQCKHCDVPLERDGEGGWRHKIPKQARGRFPCGRPEWIGGLRACPDCGLTVADVPLRTRAGTNPGGRGHKWVKRRFLISGAPTSAQFVTPRRIFMPGRIEDNPSLNEEEYIESMEESGLSVVERSQLIRGDWEITEEGRMFQRHWFTGEGMAA
jgi:hypothetical protein